MGGSGKRAKHWIAPIAALTLVAGASLTVAVTASADQPTPTAAELLTAVQQPTVAALSGTVVTRGDLGLPRVPTALDTSGPFSLNDDEVTAQVWSAGPKAQRITIGSDAAELTAIHDADGLTIWSATDNEVTRVSASEDLRNMLPGADEPAVPRTPADIANEVLTALETDSTVTVADGTGVAGRATYELLLTPNDPETLVAKVVVAVDAKTYVPLRLQVFSTELTAPAFESGFTEIDYAQPPEAVFDLEIPADATVTERTLTPQDQPKDDKPEPQVVGDGWSAVAVGELDVADLIAKASDKGAGDGAALDSQAAAEVAMTFMSLPQVSGEWGSGRVIEGTLFSVLITDDGRYAVGAVSPDSLTVALTAS